MLGSKIFINSVKLVFFLGFLSLSFYPSSLCAYRQPHSLRHQPLKVDEALGDHIIETLRNQRLANDYYLTFEVEALARRKQSSPSFSLEGKLWGSWNEKGPINRVVVSEKDSSTDASEQTITSIRKKITLLAQSGRMPLLWKYIPSKGEDYDTSKIQQLTGRALFTPLIPNIDFTPFDILMPFIFWQDYKYEGKTQTGRQVHRYILYPPPEIKQNTAQLSSIRIFIDDQFRALTKIEMLDENGESYRSFRIRSFQKVDGQYIIKEIDFFDEVRRSKARFRVNTAHVNLSLPSNIFLPENLDKQLTFYPSH